MFRQQRLSRIIPAVGVVAVVLSGCGENGWRLGKNPPPEPEPRPLPAPDAVLGGTIGAHTMVGSGDPLHLRGFGLVVGLGENGGSDCPSTIRDYLLEYLTREFAARRPGQRKPDYSPEQMIDSPDTAVVAVHGLVPAGAPRGNRFDLQLQAVDTQTRSLEGGVLVLCEMKRFEVASSGRGLFSGSTLAQARGLVYTYPARESDPTTAQRTARQGYVLGGGRTEVDRTIRLLLQEPSYWMARKIERRVNERFGQNPPVAQAISKGYLRLKTPALCAENPARFVELVTHLYLDSTPQLIEQRLGELAQQLDGSDSTLNHISLAWEGMGRTVIPHIQPLYTHARPAVRFYASRAGLRLKDVSALATMEQIAAMPDHAHRLPAVRELGECGYPQAAQRLARLLDSDDYEVRVAAYQGLLNHHHPAVETLQLRSARDPLQINLTLDVVESNARPLIYVHRTLEPRIAVFGRAMPVSLPLFYNHPGDWVTLNALQEHGDITILCRTPSGRLMPEPLMVPARVVELIRALADLPVEDDDDQQMRGIGLDYAQVVEVLDALCTSGAIPARLAVQTASGADLLGPAELPERPEADEVSPSDDEWGEDDEDFEPEPESEPYWQRPE